MKVIVFVFLALAGIGASAQPTKRDIAEKKIKSITSVYYNETGEKEYSQKTWFSVKGYDSLEYFNDELAFKFTPEMNSNGTIKQLARTDMENREDEVHLYNYSKDGSYTVEIIAHGAGTVSFSEYNAAGDCISEIFSSTDTVVYSNNALGKLAGVQEKKSGSLTDVMKAEFDSKGYPILANIFGEMPSVIRFKNNSLGLPEEIKQYTKTASGDKLESTVTFAYEFY